MILRTTLGKENFPNVGACKLQCFFVPTLSFPARQECHVSQLPKGAVMGLAANQHGAASRTPAAQGFKPELYGEWTQANIDIPDGVVLKIFAEKKLPGGQPTLATLFVQVRSSAAFQRVNFQTTGWGRGSFANVCIEGRFDVLTAQDRRRLGVKVMPAYERFCEPAMVARLLRLEQIAGETAPRRVVESERVENADGQEVEVQVARSRRRLDL